MNLFTFCDHTQQPLQRRPAPVSKFNIGLPGIGSIISGSFNSQGGYIYYCPTCKTNLPPGQNTRWQALFAQKTNPTTRFQGNEAGIKPGVKPGTGSKISYKREPIGAKLRYDIFSRDGFRCVKCGATKDQSRLHVDHIKPVVQGGKNNPANLQTLCEKCNLGKGARYG